MKRNNDPAFAGYYPSIPDGEYDAVVIGYDRKHYFDGEKLYLKFRIFSEPYVGTELFMPFNLPGKIRPSSKYYKEWVKANHGIEPAKNKCMSPKVFKNKPYRVKTRTVKVNSKQAKHSGQEYSVIDEITDVLAGQPEQQQSKMRPR